MTTYVIKQGYTEFGMDQTLLVYAGPSLEEAIDQATRLLKRGLLHHHWLKMQIWETPEHPGDTLLYDPTIEWKYRFDNLLELARKNQNQKQIKSLLVLKQMPRSLRPVRGPTAIS